MYLFIECNNYSYLIFNEKKLFLAIFQVFLKCVEKKALVEFLIVLKVTEIDLDFFVSEVLSEIRWRRSLIKNCFEVKFFHD